MICHTVICAVVMKVACCNSQAPQKYECLEQCSISQQAAQLLSVRSAFIAELMFTGAMQSQYMQEARVPATPHACIQCALLHT